MKFRIVRKETIVKKTNVYGRLSIEIIGTGI